MTICPHTLHQCHCQPQEGVMCPHGETPGEANRREVRNCMSDLGDKLKEIRQRGIDSGEVTSEDGEAVMTKQMDDVLEFLRAFISGGSQQDFKLWAGELYQKLYRSADEPIALPNACMIVVRGALSEEQIALLAKRSVSIVEQEPAGQATSEMWVPPEGEFAYWTERTPEQMNRQSEPKAPPELGRWGVSKADWKRFSNLFGRLAMESEDRAFAQLPDEAETDLDVCVRVINQLCTALNRQAEPSGDSGSFAPADEPTRDAARYRWLREGSMCSVPQVYADDDCNTWLHGEELDKAMDAAMNSENQMAEPGASLFATATYFNALKLENGYEVTIRMADASALIEAFGKEHQNRR